MFLPLLCLCIGTLGIPQLRFGPVGAVLGPRIDLNPDGSDPGAELSEGSAQFSSSLPFIPASPCARMFEYRTYGSEVMGFATIPVPTRSSATEPIKLLITLSIAAQLPSKYVGAVELNEDKNDVFSRLEIGDYQPIQYRVRFPLRNPIPVLTRIEVNGQIVCQGRSLTTGAVITTLSLDHSLFPGATGLSPTPQNNNNNQQPSRPGQNNNNQQPSRPGQNNNNYNNNNNNFNNNYRPVVNPVAVVPQQPSVQWPVQPQVVAPPQPVPTIHQTIDLSNTNDGSANEECGVIIKVQHLVQNGEGTVQGDWPWLAAIYVKTNVGQDFQCGGSLVSTSHVVTAAHCVKDPNMAAHSAESITLYLGRFNLRKAEPLSQPRDASRIVLHPSYGGGKYDNDVAIIFLESPVFISAVVRPVCLWPANKPSLDVVIQKKGTVIGWGRDEQGNRVSDEPKKVEMPVVAQEECLRSHRNFYYLTTDNTFCAGGRDGSGPCNGDSGGGMYFSEPAQGGSRWMLRGVVSLSLQVENTKQCDLSNYVVFTDIAKFSSWISSVMRS